MILLKLLAKELGLPITPYEGTICQVAGYIGHFIGKLSTVKVQLYDYIELVGGKIKVIAAAGNKLQFVLGMDLFAPAETKLQEVLVQTKKGVQSSIVEVGPQHSGELFRLPLKVDEVQTATDSTVYATLEELKVIMVPKCD